MTSNPVVDSLLVHASFVQRLARGLAGQDGDDLAQDTWVQALAADPTDLRRERSWLATVAANLWRNHRRSAARRQQREAVAGAADVAAAPSVAAILEREELRRRVVAAVVELPERLRRVVMLRFFEGLDSARIGQQLALPASTVREQLQQALAQLRRRLDAEHGERRAAWAMPLAGWFGSPATSGLGVLLRVVWPLRAVGGALALLLLAWLTLPLWFGAPGAPPLPPAGPIEVVVANRDAEPERPEAAPQRQRASHEVAAADVRGPEDLWGRIVAAADGAPVVGAEVVLEHRDADEMTSIDREYGKRREVLGTARSDAEGRFQFRVVRALQHRLLVRAAGFATRQEANCTGGSEFVVRLDRASFVDGTVRSNDGSPLGDVLVEAIEPGSDADGERTRTAPDGSFFLGGLGSRPTYVKVSPRGMQAPKWERVELTPGQGQHLDFTIEPGRMVHGVVRDAETKLPIAGAAVAASWTMAGAVTTAADGSYECRGFGAGPLFVRADGYADEVQHVAAKEDVVVVDFALVHGDEVTGRVVDPVGRGIVGTYVAAAADQEVRSGYRHTVWRPAVVAADGRFRIRGLGRTYQHENGIQNWHQWQLLVRAPGHGTRVLALPVRETSPGDIDVGTVVLQPQALLEGRVVDPEGRPVVRAEVTLQGTANGIGQLLAPGAEAPDPQSHFGRRTTFTAADGTFRFAGLGGGSYRLRAQPDGKEWDVAGGPYELVDGAIFTTPDLVADPGLVIQGSLRLAGGRELPAGSRFTLYAHGEQSEQQYGKVAADGAFCIERLDPGTYVLSVLDVPKGFAMAPRPGVAAGTKGLELTLDVAATIEGRVVGPDDQPARGLSVNFWPEGVIFSHSVSTDAEGRFRLEAAPGVTGKVSVQDPGNPFRQVRQDGVVAGARELVLKLPN